MKKFEYKTEKNCVNEELNVMGESGWELISIYQVHQGLTKFVFKREKIK